MGRVFGASQALEFGLTRVGSESEHLYCSQDTGLCLSYSYAWVGYLLTVTATQVHIYMVTCVCAWSRVYAWCM